ncbi:MAG: hypothetical protein A2107_12865 [Verrucomicrobia bacterium GWF2_62_7]|nr:MAG: hypothetical protein A2107_12865 [Verrucomicrobia bacterium GWF2_62_7]
MRRHGNGERSALNKPLLTLMLDPALLADVQAAALESGMEVGEWALRSLRLAVAAAESHARGHAASD